MIETISASNNLQALVHTKVLLNEVYSNIQHCCKYIHDGTIVVNAKGDGNTNKRFNAHSCHLFIGFICKLMQSNTGLLFFRSLNMEQEAREREREREKERAKGLLSGITTSTSPGCDNSKFVKAMNYNTVDTNMKQYVI